MWSLHDAEGLVQLKRPINMVLDISLHGILTEIQLYAKLTHKSLHQNIHDTFSPLSYVHLPQKG